MARRGVEACGRPIGGFLQGAEVIIQSARRATEITPLLVRQRWPCSHRPLWLSVGVLAGAAVKISNIGLMIFMVGNGTRIPYWKKYFLWRP
ncbi:hypothetical protein SAMN04488571_101134 [Methanoculleus thermophilus]|uniref:Uncharacterized protein n=1 Tax=Methanoculleus thermophilus TaxID=2200 RepID=A0A1G8WVU8_9EURY|nr:hypothetical protein SAMN04488571_101134 [Methanoculleus thermophilus]